MIRFRCEEKYDDVTVRETDGGFVIACDECGHHKTYKHLGRIRGWRGIGDKTVCPKCGDPSETACDEYGIDTWDQLNYGRLLVHLVDGEMFRQITGKEPPPTPISPETYAEAGLPWPELP